MKKLLLILSLIATVNLLCMEPKGLQLELPGHHGETVVEMKPDCLSSLLRPSNNGKVKKHGRGKAKTVAGQAVELPSKNSFNLVAEVHQVPVVCSGHKKGVRQMDNHELKGHSVYLDSVVLSEDANMMVLGGEHRSLEVWNLQNGCRQKLKCHTDMFTPAVLSRNKKTIVCGGYEGKIVFLDLQEDGSWVERVLKGRGERVNSVALSGNGKRVASTRGDKKFTILDLQEDGSWAGQTFKGHDKMIYSIAISEDGRRIVSGGWDNKVIVWDQQEGGLAKQELVGHTNWVYSVAISPDGKRIASGGEDNKVIVWDWQPGDSWNKTVLNGHTDCIWSVCISNDGNKICSAGTDKNIIVWDYQDGVWNNEMFKGHTDYIYSLASSEKGRMVSVGADRKVMVWNSGI
jgi:WD40 repeat protein